MKRFEFLLAILVIGAGQIQAADGDYSSFYPLLPSDTRQHNPMFQVVQGARGEAAGLRITVCNSQGYTVLSKDDYMSKGVKVIIDLIDSNGNIVNDLVLDQMIEITIVRTEQGSTPDTSFFPFETSEYPIPNYLTQMDGIIKTLMNLEAEQVTLTATAAGLTDAAPVTVEFRDPGRMKGNLILPAGAKVSMIVLYAQLQSDSTTVRNFLMMPSSGSILPTQQPIPYDIGDLHTAAYVVTTMISYQDGTGTHIQTLCSSNSPLKSNVIEGQTKVFPDYTFTTLTPGGIQGTVSLEGRSSLSGTTVRITAYPINNSTCVNMSDNTTVLTNNTEPANSNYSIPYVPPGVYSVEAYGSTIPASSTEWVLYVSQQITVPATGSTTLNLNLPFGTYPRSYQTIIYESPVNLGATSAQPIFQWSNNPSLITPVPPAWFDPNKIVYYIGVFDRCDRQAWGQQNLQCVCSPPNYQATYGQTVTGTVPQVPAASLASSPYYQQVLNWTVSGMQVPSMATSTPGPTPTPSVTTPAGPTHTPSPSETPTATPEPTPMSRLLEGLLGVGEPLTEEEFNAADKNQDLILDIADLLYS